MWTVFGGSIIWFFCRPAAPKTAPLHSPRSALSNALFPVFPTPKLAILVPPPPPNHATAQLIYSLMPILIFCRCPTFDHHQAHDKCIFRTCPRPARAQRRLCPQLCAVTCFTKTLATTPMSRRDLCTNTRRKNPCWRRTWSCRRRAHTFSRPGRIPARPSPATQTRFRRRRLCPPRHPQTPRWPRTRPRTRRGATARRSWPAPARCTRTCCPRRCRRCARPWWRTCCTCCACPCRAPRSAAAFWTRCRATFTASGSGPSPWTRPSTPSWWSWRRCPWP